MYPGANTPCMICHDKNNTWTKQKLCQMQEICNRHQSTADINIVHTHLPWHFNAHCKYGLSCPELMQYNRECQHIADHISKDLIAIAIDGDSDYYQILQLCRGDFPQIYHHLEAIRQSY